MCDSICMLDGWKKSRGAITELKRAAVLNMQACEIDGERIKWVKRGARELISREGL